MTLLILLLLATGILLGGSYYAYRIAFYSPMKGRDQIPSTSGHQYDPYRPEMARIYKQLTERPCEFVTATSYDGLILSGRYYHVKDGAPLDIGFHGYRSSPMTDFSGGSELTFQMEHNLLLVDQRAHGKSQGRTISFGILERQDLLTWVNYAIERFGNDINILLYGISMGGATVLMASELELPDNVKGIIADCPYSSPLDIILHVGRDMPIPQWLIRPFAIWGAKIFGGFDLNETTADKSAANAKVPILILHGESDNYVPCEMSDIVLANANLIQRHTFPGADHGISYLVDKDRYRNLVSEFVNKYIP